MDKNGFETFLKNNGGIICTILGSIGTIVTSILSIRSYKRSTEKIKKLEEDTPKNRTKVYLKEYALPIISGAATIGFILGSNSFYPKETILSNASAPLLAATADTVSKIKDKEDRFKKIPETNEKLTWVDWITLHTFEATIQDLINIEQEINRHIAEDGIFLLSSYCEILHIPYIDNEYEMGWNEPIKFNFERMFTDDGTLSLCTLFPDSNSGLIVL